MKYERKVNKNELIEYRIKNPLSTLEEVGGNIVSKQRVYQILQKAGLQTANANWGKNFICPKCGLKSWRKGLLCTKCKKEERKGMEALEKLLLETSDIPIFRAIKRKGEIFAIPDSGGNYRALEAEQVERALTEPHCGFGVDVRIGNKWFPLAH